MTSFGFRQLIARFLAVFVTLALVFTPFLAQAQQITTPPDAFTTFANRIISGATANSNSAYLNGRVNPNGLHTVYWFEYGQSRDLGFKTAEKNLSYNSQLSDVFDFAVGLPYGTNYYRIAARNNAGLSYGSITSFVVETPAVLGATTQFGGGGTPAVVTLPATQVSAHTGSAFFNGRVNPQGQHTIAWFEYGPTPNLGLRTGHDALGSGRSFVEVNIFTLGLFPGANYYRMVGQNVSGTTRGAIVSLFLDPAGSSAQTNNNQSGGSGVGSGSNNAGSGSNYFGTVAGSETVNENDPSLFTNFTKPTSVGNDDLTTIITTDNADALAGSNFSYVAIFKNNSAGPLGNVGFKITLPPRVTYLNSNIEPTEVRHGYVAFDIGNFEAHEQKELVMEVFIGSDVAVGSRLVFSSILTYKGRNGIDRAVTSYSVVNIIGLVSEEKEKNYLLGLLGALFTFSGLLWLGILALIALTVFLVYRYRKNRAEILKKLKNGDDSDQDNGFIDGFEDQTKKTKKPSIPANLPGIPVAASLSPLRYRPNGRQ